MKPFKLVLSLSCAFAYGLVTQTPAQAKSGGNGWQTPQTITIPAGTTDAFEHAYCPSGFNAISGGEFAVNNTTLQNGFIVTGAGPRLDLNPPQYNEWVWNFEWPAGGAVSGSQVVINVNCKKGAP